MTASSDVEAAQYFGHFYVGVNALIDRALADEPMLEARLKNRPLDLTARH